MLEMMNLGTVKLPAGGGRVKKFAAGQQGIVVLMESGKLYGRGSQYFSGTGSTVNTWKLLGTDIADVWTGPVSTLARTTDDRWLFMGLNQYFNTGFGTTWSALTDVTVDMPIPVGLTVKQVVMGYINVAVVFSNGQYAMCGTNVSGGLGVGNTSPVRTLTLRTDFTNVEKIDLDWGTYDTSYLLTKGGDVYVAGQSSYGQNGTQSSSTSWLRQSPISGGTVVDIVGTALGFFRIVLASGSYRIYGQGRDINNSLGTNTTSNTPRLAPVLVLSGIASAVRPRVYISHYAARVIDSDGVVYYTGQGTGDLQGVGTTPQPTYRVFSQLDPIVPSVGDYFATKSQYMTNYYLEDGILYGVGQGTQATQLLPGYGTTQVLTFSVLELPE